MICFGAFRHWKFLRVRTKCRSSWFTTACSFCVFICCVAYLLTNIGDILAFYILPGSRFLPLSIHCNGGRLGNQMCTYATLYGLSTINNGRNVKALRCNWKHLHQHFPKLSIEKLGFMFYIKWKSWTVKSYFRTKDAMIPTDSNYIRGFRHPCSYTFFDHAKEALRQEFSFTKDVQYHAQRVLRKANVLGWPNVTYVGVHVRRGDYPGGWLKPFEGEEVNEEYFRRAVEYFRTRYENVVFVTVSDDRVWCIKNLAVKFGMQIAEDVPSPAHDLAILANCNHTIMTYGTFGFWGGYLAGGEVVYFDKFLKPNTTFTRDKFLFEKMYPPSWIGISTTNISRS